MFGSAARGDDTSESDLDLLIDPTAETTLLDVGAIRTSSRALRVIPKRLKPLVWLAFHPPLW